MASSAFAWLEDALTPSATDASPDDQSADVTLSTGDGSGSWWDNFVNFVESPFQGLQNMVNGVENTALLAVVIIAVLIIAVVALIGFAPNVKHIIPHFV